MKKTNKKAILVRLFHLKFDKASRQGFTLIELLLVIIIISILSGIIFISLGNQRKKAKLSAALQTARGSLAIAQECYFRLESVDLPDDADNPSNEICQYSKTIWPPMTVFDCHYAPVNGVSNHFYVIECPTYNQKVECGFRPSEKCEIKDII